jgi:hypothetical protein
VCSRGAGAIAAAPLPALCRLEMRQLTIRLRLSEPGLAEDLASYLSRHDCRAVAAEDSSVIVELPHLLHQEQARLELELYLRLWQAVRGVSVARLQ